MKSSKFKKAPNRVTAIVVALCAAISMSGSSIAQDQKASPSLVYDMRMSGRGPQLPGGGGMDMKMTVAFKTTDANGTRHGTVSFSMPQLPQMGSAPIDATISPAGAISLNVDPSALKKPHMGMSKAEIAAETAASQGAMMQMQLQPFNAFASACGAQQSLRPGYSWHAASQQPLPMDITYTVLGRESHAGRDTFSIAMKGTEAAVGALTGQGYYDPAAHLVAALHYELKSQENQSTEIMDITLANP